MIDTARRLGLDTAMSKKKGAAAKGEPSGQGTAPPLPPGVKLVRTLRGHTLDRAHRVVAGRADAGVAVGGQDDPAVGCRDGRVPAHVEGYTDAVV